MRGFGQSEGFNTALKACHFGTDLLADVGPNTVVMVKLDRARLFRPRLWLRVFIHDRPLPLSIQ
ncbi:hypothetical protein AU15_04530 [Marinobacter salarius]|uniref:Uncharacterized protein n=1 Tax=Marinobacter salarius TaxID=1420917 RepID=W5YVC8_9GAMM|nr:hypothetical protein AU15_04530 [Marinobacter salarius]